MAEVSDPWDEHAEWWRAGFTRGADPEYRDQILPLAVDLISPDAGDRVLDAGCGEGHVARRLAAAGAAVVGIDSSAAQIAAAGAAGADGPGWGTTRFARADIGSLPFAPASFDAACIVLVLEHAADLGGTVAELARVVRPGGRVVVFLNHPLFQTPDSGWVDDHILDEKYWRVGEYLNEVTTDEEVDRGVVLPFHHRPLSRYVNAFIDAGCRLVRLLEPPPPASFVALAPAYAQSTAIPRLAILVFERQLANQN